MSLEQEMSIFIMDRYLNPNVCHICKIYKTDVKMCTGCHLVSYCGFDHKLEHWDSHKKLCKAVQEIRKMEDGGYYYDTFENHVEELVNGDPWTNYKSRLVLLVHLYLRSSSNESNDDTEYQSYRPLNKTEKSMILNPKICYICHCTDLTRKILTCEECYSINYCTSHSINVNHACKELKCIYNMYKYLINEYSNDFKNIEEMISNHYIEHKVDNIYDRLILNEYTSYFRTLIHLLQTCNINKESITIHIVGPVEYECSHYTIYLWENIFHHLIKDKNNKIKYINLIFVGFNNNCNEAQPNFLKSKVLPNVNCSKEIILCETCILKENKLFGEHLPMHYHKYIDKKYYEDEFVQRFRNACLIQEDENEYNFDKKKYIEVDLIIAYNARFHKHYSYEDKNIWQWKETLLYFLKYRNIPIAFTSYSKKEININTNLIKKLGRHLALDFILDCKKNVACSLRPRINPDKTTSVYFYNKYVSCFKVHTSDVMQISEASQQKCDPAGP